jgi:hypothetical protein
MFELQHSGDHFFLALPATLSIFSVDHFIIMTMVFPEELLERVLAHAIINPASPHHRAS